MKRSLHALAAIAAAATLVLAGCSGGGEGGNSGGDSGSGDAKTPPLSDINPVDRDKVQDGGELKLAISQFPEQWNLMHSAGNQVDNETINSFVMPTNWDYADDGSVTPNENYVLETKVEDGPPQVVTITLNPEAKWNSGTPITWKDYEATWRAANGTNNEFSVASTDGFNQVAKVEKGKDEFQVVITYKSTYPDWTGNWSSVEPKAAVDTPDLFNNARAGEPKNEFTAGPFKFDKVNKAERVVTLVPNDAWWGDPPKLDKVSFRELDPDMTTKAFANSEVDVVDGLINADQYSTAQNRPDGEIRKSGGLQWRHFTFNAKSGGLLKDKAIRQAIVKGLDREKIAASDLAGLPVDPAELMLGNHFFMPGQDGYQDNSTDYKYDPKAAGEELDKLGWTLKEGQKFRTNDKGEELTIEYQLISGVPTSENEGKLLQDNMAAIGVNVKMVNKSPDDFPGYMESGSYGITSFAWQGTQYPMANVYQVYGCGSKSNYTGLCDDAITNYIKKIDVEMDKDKRMKMTNEVDKIIWDDVMTVPLYRRPEYVAVPKNLANYGAFGLSTGRVENIGFVAK